MKRVALLALWLAAGTAAVRGQTLRLGIYDNPPLTFMADGVPSGFIVDIIRDFGRSAQTEVRFVQAPFHELFAMLRRDEVDVIAPIAFSQERSRYLSFSSESVLIDWSVLVIGESADFKLLSDLAGKRIGVVRSDHYARQFAADLRLQRIQCRFVEYDGFEAVVAAVVAGRIDAGFIGRFGLSHIMRRAPRLARFKVMPGSFYHEPLYFGVNPRQAGLAARLDAYLRQARNAPHGALERSYERWFGQSPSQRRLEFLSRNYPWLLLAVLATIALFLAFNLLLRRRVRKGVQEVNRQKSYFENLFQVMPAGIVILDERNRVLNANREFESMFGYALDEIRGRELPDLINTEETLPEARRLSRLAAEGQRVYADVRRRRKSGELLDLHLIASPILFEDAVAGIIVIYLDVTERKRMEEEIIKAKNLESVGLLAGGIAHDFNNMLTGILGNISVARGMAGAGPGRGILEKAEKAALKASGLTRQLLTFSKGGFPVKTVVDLPDLVRDSLDLVVSGSNVRADLSIAGPIPPCEVDATQVLQVINNLLINAREAMPAGGVVEVTVGTHRQAKGNSALPPGRYVSLRVRDDGPGIPAGDLQRIFIPYYTTKKTGSGLGLAIAYSIVSKHGGTIRVASEPGRGAAFTVYLPASDKPLGEAPPSAGGSQRRGRILLMDDEEIVRDVFVDMLRDTPYRVDLAADSGEALGKVAAALERGTPYDLVFLDLTGPGDIGGVKTLERIRAVAPKTVAIAFSGYSVSEVASHPGRFHFSDFLAKPFRPEELLEIIARNLPRAAPSP